MREQVFNEFLNIGLIVTPAQVQLPSENHYYLRGSEEQMYNAASVAVALGIKIHYDGMTPYVESQEDFNKLAQYLIELEVEGCGYWNY